MSSRHVTPPRRHPTLATVAHEAGVSRQTVSNALNSPELLRPDTLARVQEADRQAGLLAEPGRAQPAHPLLAPGRAARRPGGRGQRQRADGPLRALAGGEHRGRRLPRPAVHAAGDHRATEAVRRAAALRVGGRVRGHRHLPRQPARGVAHRAAGAVRRLRPAGGTTRRPGTRGSTWTAGRASRSPSTTSSSAATPGSPGWAGRRARSSARTGAAAGSPGCTSTGCPPAGCRPVATTPWSSAAGPRTRCSTCPTGPAHGVRVRQRHPRDGRAARRSTSAACESAATSRSSGSTTRSPPRCAPRRSPRCASPWSRSRSRWCATSELLAHRPIPEPGCVLAPTLSVRASGHRGSVTRAGPRATRRAEGDAERDRHRPVDEEGVDLGVV